MLSLCCFFLNFWWELINLWCLFITKRDNSCIMRNLFQDFITKQKQKMRKWTALKNMHLRWADNSWWWWLWYHFYFKSLFGTSNVLIADMDHCLCSLFHVVLWFGNLNRQKLPLHTFYHASFCYPKHIVSYKRFQKCVLKFTKLAEIKSIC